MRLRALLAACAVAGCVLGGCAGDGVTDEVKVTTEEMKFLPKTLRVLPGRRTFVVKNSGEVRHTFSLNELGEEVTVEPGKTRSFTAELEPGTYTYVCRILDHEGLGMRGTLRVSAN